MTTRTGGCHCGSVTWTTATDPAWLTECNCSVCSRYGALWGHRPRSDIHIDGREHTQPYRWGDRLLAFHFCRHCGCVTHWESEDPAADANMAVNFRMAPIEERAGLRTRRFDGAQTWAFLDE